MFLHKTITRKIIVVISTLCFWSNTSFIAFSQPVNMIPGSGLGHVGEHTWIPGGAHVGMHAGEHRLMHEGGHTGVTTGYPQAIRPGAIMNIIVPSGTNLPDLIVPRGATIVIDLKNSPDHNWSFVDRFFQTHHQDWSSSNNVAHSNLYHWSSGNNSTQTHNNINYSNHDWSSAHNASQINLNNWGSKINLDLSSTVESILGGHSLNNKAIDISVGQSTLAVTANTLLTPAEKIAVFEVLSGGQQTLILGTSGSAVGGSFNLSPRLSLHLSSLDIPTGVTAIANVSHIPTLTLSGNLINSGTLDIVSSNPSLSTVSLFANNITNTGLLTTVGESFQGTPAGGSPSLNLNLLAANNIINSGTISSSGALSLKAGGSIINSAATQTSTAEMLPAQPSIQSTGSLNLVTGSGTIVNQGLMASSTVNINFSTISPSTDLNVTNTGGTFQAASGAINVRDAGYSGTGNVNLTGGNWVSKELNTYSGTGAVAIDVGILTGVVNTTAGSAHILAMTPDLQLGALNVTGDPFVSNNAGNVNLSSVTFPAIYLVATASGSIYTSSASTNINTSSSSGNGGNVVLAAGVTSTDTSGSITLARSGTGGDIYLTTGTTLDSNATQNITGFNTSSGNSGSSGGNVTLIAMSSVAGNNTGGHIYLPSTVQIINHGIGTGANGTVTIIAEATEPSANAISIGGVASVGSLWGSGGGGAVDIKVATPNLSGVIISDSTAAITGSVDSTTYQNGGITTGSGGIYGYYTTVTIYGGSLAIGGNVGDYSFNSIAASFTATGSGTISGRTVVATTLNLTTGTGDIYSTSDSSSYPLATTASTISLNTQGNVYLSDTINVTISNVTNSPASVYLTNSWGTGGTAITVGASGLTSTGAVTLITTGSNSENISLAGPVSGTNVTFTASGYNGYISSTSSSNTVTASSLTLTSPGANASIQINSDLQIVTAGHTLYLASDPSSLSASSGTGVYVGNTSSITFGAAEAVSLTGTSGASIYLGASSISANGGLTLTVSGTGTISQSGGTVTTTILNLITGTGYIYGTSDSSSHPLMIVASTIFLNTQGHAYLSDTSNVSISNVTNTPATVYLTVSGSSGGTGITVGASGLTSTGAITLINTGTNSSISLAGVLSGTNVTMTVPGTGTITSTSSSNTVTASGASGLTLNFGSTASTINSDLQITNTGTLYLASDPAKLTINNNVAGFTVGSTASVTFGASEVVSLNTNGGNISLGANTITANGGLILSATATGTISQTAGGSVATTGTLTLDTATGDIYGSSDSSSHPLLTAASTIVLNSQGHVYLSDTSNVSISNNTPNPAAVYLTVAGSSGGTGITIGALGLYSSGAITLINTGTNSSISLAGSLSGTNMIMTATGTITSTSSGNTVTASGASGLTLNFGTTGVTINSPTQITNTGTLYLASNPSQLNVNTGGGITVASTASVTFGGSEIVSLNGGAGSISLGANTITANGGLTLTASDPGTISQSVGGSVATSGTLSLVTGTGDIYGSADSSSNPFATAASTISLNTQGNAYLSDTSNATISNVTNSPASVYLTVAGTSGGTGITIGALGLYSSGAITLINTGTNSSIALAGNLSGSSSTVALTATGIGTISQSGSKTVTATTLNLTTGSGDIYGSSDSSTHPLITAASTISLNTQGQVFLSDNSNVIISSTSNTPTRVYLTVAGSSGGTGITVGASGLTSANFMTLIDTGTNSSISLGGVLSGGTMTMTATGTGTITSTSSSNTVTASGAITLNFGTPSITINSPTQITNTGTLYLASNPSSLSVNTGGSITVASTSGVSFGETVSLATTASNISLGANIITTTGSLNLTTSGPGTISQSSGGSVAAIGTLNLITGTGDIYGSADDSSHPLSTATSTIALNTQGNVYLSDTANATISSNSNNPGSVYLTVTGSSGGTGITVGFGGLTSTGGITLINTGTNSSISLAGVLSGTNVILTATGTGTIISTAAAKTVTASGASGLTLNFGATAPAMSINSPTQITDSGTLYLASNPSQLNISTGGSITVASTSSVTFAASEVVSLTTMNSNISLGANTITVNGGLTLSASGSGTISQTAGGSVATTGTLALTTGTGDIYGSADSSSHPLFTAASTITAPAGGNVYMRNTGSVTLSGASSAGNSDTFSLTITASSGNGAILLGSGATVTVAGAGAIDLTSASSSAGSGSITQVNALTTATLSAATINLNAAGSGSNAISLGTTHGTSAVTLNALGSGNVTVQNIGQVTLSGASSAGSGDTFSLTTTTDTNHTDSISIASGATVTVAGSGTIDLTSASSGAGLGYIVQDNALSTPALIANTINLQANGTGTGTPPLPLTNANDIYVGVINNGSSSVLVIPVTNTGNITIQASGSITLPGMTTTGKNIQINSVGGNITVTGNTSTSSGGNVTLVATGGVTTGGITTSGNSGGNIVVTATTGDILASGASYITQGSGSGNRAGDIDLTASSGNIEIGVVDASGQGGANGGNITILSTNLKAFSTNTSGNSIDFSSYGGGDAGNIIIQTSSNNTLVIGGATGDNYVAGNIAANGVNAGNINFENQGGQNVLVGAVVSAVGTTGSGGKILFTYYDDYTMPLTVTINGLVIATNNLNNSGRIGFNSGPGQDLNVYGTGTLHAGEWSAFGNLNTSTLDLAPVNAGTLTPYPVSLLLVGGFKCNCTNCYPVPTPLSNSGLFSYFVPSSSPSTASINIPLVIPVTGSLYPTDTLQETYFINKVPPGTVEILTLALPDNKESTVFNVSSKNGGLYSFATDNETLILANPGTIFAVTEDRTITLKQGSLCILSKQQPVNIITDVGTIKTAENSHLVVTCKKAGFGIVQVTSFDEQPTNLGFSHNHSQAQLTLEQGEEKVLKSMKVAIADTSEFYTQLYPKFSDSLVPGVSVTRKSIDKDIIEQLLNFRKQKIAFENAGMKRRFNEFLSDLNTKQKMTWQPFPHQPVDANNYQSIAQIVELGNQINLALVLPMPNMTQDIRNLEFSQGYISYTSGTELSSVGFDHKKLTKGDALVETTGPLSLDMPNCCLKMKTGSVVLVSAANNVVEARTLKDESSDAVVAIINNRVTTIPQGTELIIGPSDESLWNEMSKESVGRRNVRHIVLEGSNLVIIQGEYSIPSLFGSNPMLDLLYRSNDKADRKVLGHIIKAAACLECMTSHRGRFEGQLNYIWTWRR